MTNTTKFRPKAITLTLTQFEHDRLKAASESMGLSMASFVRMLIKKRQNNIRDKKKYHPSKMLG